MRHGRRSKLLVLFSAAAALSDPASASVGDGLSDALRSKLMLSFIVGMIMIGILIGLYRSR